MSMAEKNESDNDNVARDAQLARLYAAASEDAPPAALDAAILAAARREIGARPQAVGGGEVGAVVPAPRARRNWYVPVSLAAVLVLSVSLVTVMQQEKGDELAQPRSEAPPELAKTPAPAPAPAPATAPLPAAPAADAPKPAAPAAQPSKPEAYAEQKAPEPPRAADAVGASAAREQSEKRKALADNAAVPNVVTPPPAAPASPRADAASGKEAERAPAPAAAPPAAAPPPAVAQAAPPRAEPFPGAVEREAPAMRDAAPPAAPRREADGPAGAATPVPVVPGERQVAPAESPRTRAAAPSVQNRAMTAPAKPLAKASESQPAARPAWLVELENQPAEKWLERLAALRRDARYAEADELLAEFRRRFPDHPAAAR